MPRVGFAGWSCLRFTCILTVRETENGKVRQEAIPTIKTVWRYLLYEKRVLYTYVGESYPFQPHIIILARSVHDERQRTPLQHPPSHLQILTLARAHSLGRKHRGPYITVFHMMTFFQHCDPFTDSPHPSKLERNDENDGTFHPNKVIKNWNILYFFSDPTPHLRSMYGDGRIWQFCLCGAN